VLAVVAVVALCLTLAGPATAGWQGKETVKDGTTYVMNPTKAMDKTKTAELEELWRIGGDTDDEDEFFGVITQIRTDKAGNVYLLDQQLAVVKIFSSEGEFVREIGREGEGPGEFRFPTGMFFLDDGTVAVLQVQPGKIVLLTPEGEPAGEHPIPTPEGGGFLQLLGAQARGSNLVMAMAANAFGEGKFEQTRYLAAIDKEGEEVARYHADTRTIMMGNAVMKDSDWDTFDRRWTVGFDGRIYACTTYLDYAVHVWQPDGTLERVVQREYAHRPRTEREVEIVSNLMNLFAARIPDCKVEIDPNTKDIESLYVRQDGSLWVLSSNGARDRAEGSIGEFDVFDGKGRFVRQIVLKGEGDPLVDGYYFVNDRLYIVTDLLQAAISFQSGGQSFELGEEEPEPMSVICYQLPSDLQLSLR
jgi:hypothetical protein